MVERYFCSRGVDFGWLEPSKNGSVVTYDDYHILEQECATLRAELKTCNEIREAEKEILIKEIETSTGLRAELSAAKKTIEARDNECRDEHYTALEECTAQLVREQQSVNELSLHSQDLATELARLRQERDGLRERGEALAKAFSGLLRKFPEEDIDYSGVGRCAGCGALHWCAGNPGPREKCKPDCVLQVARAALDHWRNHAKPLPEGPG